MKIKSIIIIVLLVLLISFATWEEIFVKSSLKEISNMATEIKKEIEVNENLTPELKQKLDNLDKKWEKTEYIFCFLTNHNDMKEIGDSICYAQTYFKQNNKDGVIERINLVIFYSESYSHILSFSIQNII